MKNFLVVLLTLILGAVAVFVLVTTLLQAKDDQDACEPFRFTVIHDVPVRCFEYFRKDFK